MQTDSRIWTDISTQWYTSIASLVFYWNIKWIFCSAGGSHQKGNGIQPIRSKHRQTQKRSIDIWKLESEADRATNTIYVLHDPNSASCIKEQHQYVSSGRISIPSSLHVLQGDPSGLCPSRYHQEVGFHILQDSPDNHGQGNSCLLRFILSSW